MHSAAPAVVIQPLRHGPFGVLGNRLGTRLTRALHRPARQAVSPWHGRHSGGARCRRRRFCAFLAAAEADLRQALQQGPVPLFGMMIVGKLAAPGANLILGR